MREHAPPHVQVKAAGGIRTFAALLEVRAAGAMRCGATRTIEMLEACKRALEFRKAVASHSQGCRSGYPGMWRRMRPYPNGVLSRRLTSVTQPRWGRGGNSATEPRVAAQPVGYGTQRRWR